MKIILGIFLVVFSLELFAQQIDSLSSEEQLAGQLLRDGDYEKAAVLYEELFEKRPTALIYNNFLRSLFELKDFRKAERIIKNQIKDHPGRARFEVDLGYLYFLENDERKFRRYMEGLIKEMSPDPSSIHELANAFLFREFDDYALQIYLKGRQTFGYSVPFNMQIAEIYSKKGDYLNMMAEYVELIIIDESSHEQVQGILQDALNDDPDSQKADNLRRVLLQGTQKDSQQTLYSELLLWLSIQQKDFEMALRQARIIDRRLQQDGKLVLDVAMVSVANNQFMTARQGFEYIINLGEVNPYFLDATVGLLNAKYKQAVSGYEIDYVMLAEVEQEYEQSIASLGLHPQTVSLVRNLANLKAFYLGNTEEASKLLDDVLKMSNVSSRVKGECRIELADILLLKGDLWDAHLLYAQVDKTFRDDPLAHEARFKNARLSFYMGEFNWAKAQLDVLKAATSRLIANDAMDLSMFIQDNLQQDSVSEPLELFGRARMHIFMNKFENALAVFDSISSLYPSHQIIDNVMMEKAKIFIKIGRYEDADMILADVTTRFPEGLLASDALFQRARLHENIFKNKDKAMELYQTLLVDYPGSLNTVTARNRFRSLRGDIINEEEIFLNSNSNFTP
jgi:tetratricopeptide (TPR) repeat protein